MSSRIFLFLFAAVLAGSPAFGSEILIQRVDFNLVDQSGARDPWYEVSVTLTVRRGAEKSTNPRFTEQVSVSLDFSTETVEAGTTRYALYDAAAIYPTLEVGRHVVRFYLPPELVKRDRVKGEPFAWQVFVDEGQEVLAEVLSNSLESASARSSYRARLDAEVKKTEGILRLQSESPFRYASPRDTPTPLQRNFGG